MVDKYFDLFGTYQAVYACELVYIIFARAASDGLSFGKGVVEISSLYG